MHCLLAALKNGKVRNHSIPVMLGEYRRMLPAMRQKSAAPKDKGQPLPSSPLAPGPGYTGLIRHLGKIPLQFLLGIPKLRVKMNTFHHDQLLLAMIETRQAQHPALIDAGLIPMELCRQPPLYPAEGVHPSILYEPVGMQGFPGFHHQRRFQRKSHDLLPLLLQR